MPYYIFSYYCIISALCYFVFGIYCVAKKPNSRINRLWGISSSTIGSWSFGLGMVVGANSLTEAKFWLSVHYFGAILIPPTFLHYIQALVESNGVQRRKGEIFFWYVLFLTLLVVNFAKQGLLVTVSDNKPFFPFYTDLAPLYPFYTIAFVLCVGSAFFKLVRELAREKSFKRKNQLKYMLLATCFGFGGGGTAFFPVFDLHIYPFGMFLVILYPLLMTYAIVRHQLLDIEVIIKRTLVFAGIVAASVLAASTPIALVQMVIGRAIGISPFFLMVNGIGVAVLIYRPLARKLEDLTDRFLFQKKVDYRKLLKEATEYLAHLDSLKKQARRIIAFLLIKARIANASIYAFQSHAPGALFLQASKPPLLPLEAKPHKTLSLSHPIAPYLRTHRNPIDLNEIEEMRRQEKEPKKQEELDAIIKLLNKHKAEACIPCFGSDAAERARRTELHLRGILFLGHQKSDEPYREEDLDVFFTLGQESSIAFENARLYDEAVERARELERINQELNDAQTDLMRALSEAEKSREQERKAKEEEKKAKEEALAAKKRTEEMQLELVQRETNRALGDMTGSVAHQMRHPISYIHYTVYFIKKKILQELTQLSQGSTIPEDGLKRLISISGDLSKHLEFVQGSGDQMNSIVRTLERFVKAESAKVKEQSLTELDKSSLDDINFQTFMQFTLERLKYRYHDRSRSTECIEIEGTQNQLILLGDQASLFEVMVNLFDNAYDALEGRTRKKITVRGYPEPQDPNYAHIEVQDTGCGMSKEVMEELFKGRKITTKPHGKGQGLLWCRNIIETIHGGRFSLESTVGVGTTVHFTLPIWKRDSSTENKNMGSKHEH